MTSSRFARDTTGNTIVIDDSGRRYRVVDGTALGLLPPPARAATVEEAKATDKVGYLPPLPEKRVRQFG